jgi:hypothetical protein
LVPVARNQEGTHVWRSVQYYVLDALYTSDFECRSTPLHTAVPVAVVDVDVDVVDVAIARNFERSRDNTAQYQINNAVPDEDADIRVQAA